MSQSDFHVATPRLYLTHFDPSSNTHCDFYVALYNSASTIRHNPDAPKMVPDREAARRRMTPNSARLAKTGYGRYLVTLKPSETAEESAQIPFSQRVLEPIGVVSMQLARHEKGPMPLIPDVGFNMDERYHGKGYATEAVKGIMAYYANEKGVERFAGLTDADNENARRLFRRLGFKEWGVRVVKGVLSEGTEADLDVWTWGVEDGKALEEFGL
jgi:RimJ/RimL family protein N-acetyltransferase